MHYRMCIVRTSLSQACRGLCRRRSWCKAPWQLRRPPEWLCSACLAMFCMTLPGEGPARSEISPEAAWQAAHEPQQGGGGCFAVETPCEAAESQAAAEAALLRCDGSFRAAMDELFAEWRTKGHAWIGERVTLTFEGNPIDAVVTKWTPADGPRIPAMWQVLHTDGGKEEQLNEAEMLVALELFAQTSPMEIPKAMGQGVTPAASRVPLAGSAMPEAAQPAQRYPRKQRGRQPTSPSRGEVGALRWKPLVRRPRARRRRRLRRQRRHRRS